MSLTKPNQELRRERKEAAAALEHADTLALTMMISGLYAGEDRVAALADEVKVGQITRAKAE